MVLATYFTLKNYNEQIDLKGWNRLWRKHFSLIQADKNYWYGEINLLDTKLLNEFYESDAVVGTKDTTVNQSYENPWFEAYILLGRRQKVNACSCQPLAQLVESCEWLWLLFFIQCLFISYIFVWPSIYCSCFVWDTVRC